MNEILVYNCIFYLLHLFLVNIRFCLIWNIQVWQICKKKENRKWPIFSFSTWPLDELSLTPIQCCCNISLLGVTSLQSHCFTPLNLSPGAKKLPVLKKSLNRAVSNIFKWKLNHSILVFSQLKPVSLMVIHPVSHEWVDVCEWSQDTPVINLNNPQCYIISGSV